MVRNRGDPEGICGINTLASYPIKSSPNPPPPPPIPTPVKCDALWYCPAGSTCCCTLYIFRFCINWGCCHLDSAVCCKDQKYCCPQDHPICDSVTAQCLKAARNMTSVTGLAQMSASILWYFMGEYILLLRALMKPARWSLTSVEITVMFKPQMKDCTQAMYCLCLNREKMYYLRLIWDLLVIVSLDFQDLYVQSCDNSLIVRACMKLASLCSGKIHVETYMYFWEILLVEAYSCSFG